MKLGLGEFVVVGSALTSSPSLCLSDVYFLVIGYLGGLYGGL